MHWVLDLLLSIFQFLLGLCLGSSSKLTPEEEAKLAKKREKIIEEIYETEKYYLSNLKVLKNDFSIPLKEKKLLSPEHHQKVFTHLETIINLHDKFFEELEGIYQSDSKSGEPKERRIGKLFMEYSPTFKLYSSYISQYSGSTQVIQENNLKNKQFVAFLEAKKKELKQQDKKMLLLGAYSILPIQRIPRYKLLLEDLLKSVTNEKDKQVLSEAVKQIHQMAKYCNDKEKETKSILKLLELHSKLKQHMCLIEPGRYLIHYDEEEKTREEDGSHMLFQALKKHEWFNCKCFLLNDVFIVEFKTSTRASSPWLIKKKEKPLFIKKIQKIETPALQEKWKVIVIHYSDQQDDQITLRFSNEEVYKQWLVHLAAFAESSK